jgi:hypothetical protein
MVAQVEYSIAGRSGGQVTPCAVCTVHVETRNTSFLVDPQHHGRRFISGLASKPPGWVVSGLASKPLGRFSLVWPQNRWRQFLLVWPQNRWWGVSRLGLKTDNYDLVIWVLKSPRCFFWFGPQNKIGYGLSVAPQNR